MPQHVESIHPLTVQVRRLLPFGLLVSLADNREGIIREREISWDRDMRREWRSYFKIGDTLEAVLLGEGRDRRVELSLRLAHNDPWFDLAKRYRLGQVVVGIVTGIQPYGIFVEIEPGVTGLLHRSELPARLHKEPIEDLFWPGDYVRVGIELVDRRQRRLRVSLAKAAHRWKLLTTPEPQTLISSSTQSMSRADSRTRPARLPLELLLKQKIPLSILVVEDDPEQRKAVTNWLQNAGQHVLPVGSAEEAFVILSQRHIDLLLMDVGLPGMDGVTAVTQIRQQFPEMRCVLMTDWARASGCLPELERLRITGVHLEMKPFLPEDLLRVLFDVVEQTDEQAAASPGQPGAVEIAPPLALPAVTPHTSDLPALLARLCQITRAPKAVLFVLDPAQRRVMAVAEAGPELLNPAAFVDLIHSPVRDVAEDQRVVQISDALLAESRVRYLKPLLPFRSCLGAPISGSFPAKYALFLFHSLAQAFNDIDKEYMLATALMVGALIEREQFHIHAVEMQRLVLLGQLSRALVHEINHQLSPVNFKLNELEDQHAYIERQIQRVAHDVDGEIHQIRDTIGQLAQHIRHLTETARLFGRVTLQHQHQLLFFTDVLEQTVYLVRDMADRAHVVIETQVLAKISSMQVPAIQVQQVLLNLLINAIQQIAIARPKEGGRIQLTVGRHAEGSRQMMQINVEDDGPGIHRRLWERIFELGFTTRRGPRPTDAPRAEGLHDDSSTLDQPEEGSGVGLYISQSLIQSIGGRVYIAQSAICWGSTFVVEIPIAD